MPRVHVVVRPACSKEKGSRQPLKHQRRTWQRHRRASFASDIHFLCFFPAELSHPLLLKLVKRSLSCERGSVKAEDVKRSAQQLNSHAAVHIVRHTIELRCLGVVNYRKTTFVDAVFPCSRSCGPQFLVPWSPCRLVLWLQGSTARERKQDEKTPREIEKTTPTTKFVDKS